MMNSKNKILFAFISIILFLTGCETEPSKFGRSNALCDSSIAKLGPDTYQSSSPNSFRQACWGSDNKYEDAEYFCRKMGKEILVTNTGYYVTFRCLNSNDPEYARPIYDSVPKYRIEDAR